MSRSGHRVQPLPTPGAGFIHKPASKKNRDAAASQALEQINSYDEAGCCAGSECSIIFFSFSLRVFRCFFIRFLRDIFCFPLAFM